MDALTYRQLQQLIAEMPQDRKDDHVTLVLDTEEVFQLKGLAVVEDGENISSILDVGHHYLHI